MNPRVPMSGCLGDVEILALLQRRLPVTARDLAFVHLALCAGCLELVAALLAVDARTQQPLQRKLDL